MIKIILLIAISASILATHGNLGLPICNFTTANQAIAPRIFAEQTIDGNKQSIVQTRFLHNKFGILGSEFTRCYFYSFDPNFIYHSTGIGIIFWLYFFYASAIRKLYVPLSFFLLIPALPFFGFPIVIVSYAHKIFAIIGLAFFLYKKK